MQNVYQGCSQLSQSFAQLWLKPASTQANVGADIVNNRATAPYFMILRIITPPLSTFTGEHFPRTRLVYAQYLKIVKINAWIVDAVFIN